MQQTPRFDQKSSRLRLWPASTCLMDQLGEELIQLDEELLPQTLVILPTSRLMRYVLAYLATKKKAFIPPQLSTLEQSVLELCLPNFQNKQLIDDIELSLFVLNHIMKLSSTSYIRRGHESELQQLYKELLSHQLFPHGFDQLKQRLEEDVWNHEEKLTALIERVDAIKEFLLSLHEHLLEQNKITTPYVYSCAAQIIEQGIQNGQISWPYQRLYIVGLTSTTPALTAALKQIIQITPQGAAEVWLTRAPKLYNITSPLQELRAQLTQDHALVEEYVDQEDFTPKYQYVLKAPDKYSEMKYIQQRIDSLIKSGCPESQIAVLVSNELDYGPLIRRTMAQDTQGHQQPNFAITFPLSILSTTSWLQLVSEFMQTARLSQLSINLLIDFILHPKTPRWFSQYGNTNHSQDAWLSWGLFVENNRNLSVAALFEQKQHPLGKLVKKQIIKWQNLDIQTTEGIEELEQLLNFLEQQEKHYLEKNNFYPSFQEKYLNFKQLIHQKKKGAHNFISHLTLGQLLQFFIQKTRLHTQGEPLAGIQVLSIPEARYLPLTHVFIVGCTEGRFPAALPRDELLDNHLKRGLGLPGWQGLEAREDTTFHLLQARLPFLYLSYPEQELGQPVVRSRFIEKALWQGAKLYTVTTTDLILNQHTVNTNKDFTSNEEGLMTQHHAQQLMNELTVTDLEAFIQCPYQFLLKKLKIMPRHIQQDDSTDLRVEGAFFHKLIEIFFEQFVRFIKKEDRKDFKNKALNFLQTKTTEQAAHYPNLAANLVYHLNYYAWPRLINFLFELYETYGWDSPTQGLGESERTLQSPWSLDQDFQIILKGQIDRYEYWPQIPAVEIIDFKRKGHPTKKEVLLGKAVQLPLYGYLLAQKLSVDPSYITLNYWSILKGEVTSLKTFGKQQHPINTAELIATVQNNITWRWNHIQSARGLRFYADPSDCKLCHYSGICRKNDPRYQEQINQQDYLRQHFDAESVHNEDHKQDDS